MTSGGPIAPDRIGESMSAYFGGRAEARIRVCPVPVVLTDFTSMYPTVNALAGLWEWSTAAELRMRNHTAAARATLKTVTLAAALTPTLWPALRFFALVVPDGDLLPVRARYGATSDAWNIGVNILTSATPLWYGGYDLATSVLRTGKVPRILRAWTLEASARRDTIRPVRFRGQIPLDPRVGDFYVQLVEERHRVRHDRTLSPVERERLAKSLKVTANSGSYGIFAQMNDVALPSGTRERVMVYGAGTPYPGDVRAVEEPGEFCFPPLAALITGAARFMLAVLETCVTEAGGTYLFTDTDSMAIVATKRGGLIACPGGPNPLRDGRPAIRALSWAHVRQLSRRFEALTPYGPVVRDPLLKIERENFTANGTQRQLYGYAISAKRYAIYTRSRRGCIRLVKYSEHGLGHLMAPTRDGGDWIATVWQRLVDQAEGVDPGPEPEWYNHPAIARLTFSSPELLRPFSDAQALLPSSQRVRPFNFLVTAPIAPLGVPSKLDAARCRVVAPYSTNVASWEEWEWRDVHSGQRVRVSTDPVARPGVVRVQTIRDVLASYAQHPEPKSSGSVGLLARRHVMLDSLAHIGKESNRLEEADAGMLAEWSEAQTTYSAVGQDTWHTEVLPALRQLDAGEVARATGISQRTVYRTMQTGRAPGKRIAATLRDHVRVARASAQ